MMWHMTLMTHLYGYGFTDLIAFSEMHFSSKGRVTSVLVQSTIDCIRVVSSENFRKFIPFFPEIC